MIRKLSILISAFVAFLAGCGGNTSNPWAPIPTKTPIHEPTKDTPPLPRPTDKIPWATPTHTLPPAPTSEPAEIPSSRLESVDIPEASPVPNLLERQSETEVHRLEEAMANEERQHMSHDEKYFQERLLLDLNEAFPMVRFVRARNYTIMTTIGGSPFYIYLREPIEEWLNSGDQDAYMRDFREKIVKRIGEAFGLESRPGHGQ